MSALEAPFAGLDSGGMAARVDGISEQIEAALESCASEPWRLQPGGPSPRWLAVGGMGGSAIAAEIVAGAHGDRLPSPLMIVRDYRWPAWVAGEGLALLCSYSGNTEESLALYREAGARGVRRVAMSTGGTLGSACAQDGVPCAPLPPGSPPRAAMYASWVRLDQLMFALGWIDDPTPAWREAAAAVRAVRARAGTAVPEAGNPLKRLARELAGRAVFIYAGTERMGPLATRLRQQLNENAKLLAHSAIVPELNHNEIVGWERPEAFHAGAAVLVLRDAEDAPEIVTRLDLTAEDARRHGAVVRPLEVGPGGRTARLAAMAATADYLSLYLAFARGVDPTPIASIDAFKQRLAKSGAQ